MIPVDGSTIQVIVDGAPLGPVNYTFFRPHLSGIFPGLKNSGGPVGYRVLDTTGLAEGLHTIAWVVTDDLGVTSGLGSRFFRVANSAEAQTPAAPGSIASVAASMDAASEIMATPPATVTAAETGRRVESLASVPVSEAPVIVHRDASPPRRLRLHEHDDRMVTLAPMERLELHLSGGDSECLARWAGFLVKDGVLADLPVGASLDPNGTFYWQTGPGVCRSL